MGNPNKTVRIVLGWTHVLVGFPIGVWMWQQARTRRRYRRLRPDGTNGPKPPEDTPGTRRLFDRHVT